MLDVSDALKKLYRMNLEPKGTKAEIKTTINFGDLGVSVTNDRLVQDSFRLTERISESGDLDFGSCNASVIEFAVADVPEDLNGQTFTVTQTVNGTYTVPLGTFTVDSCKRQDDLRFKDIVAYDNMRKFDRDVASWYNGLSFPMYLKDFRTSLCTFCGVEQVANTLVNDNIKVYKTLEVTELNGKEVLRAIAEVNGTFAHIDRYGKLTYIGLDSFALYPSETLYPADDLYPVDVTEIVEKQGENAIAYISSKYEDYTVSAIDGVIVQDDENADGGITVGTASNPYILAENMLIIGKSKAELTTIATNLLTKIGNVVYVPHETECIGLPYVEVGDTVLNANSADKELFIAKRVLTGISSVMDSFSVDGNPARENYNKVQSSEIRKLNGVSMKIRKDIDRIGVEIENLATDTNTRFEVADGRITAEVKRAQSAEASLQLSVNGLRTEVRGKVDDEEVRSIFAVEIGKITLSAEQIELNGYSKINGNFTIDNDGNLKIVGENNTADFTSNGLRITNTRYGNEAIFAVNNLIHHGIQWMTVINANSASLPKYIMLGSPKESIDELYCTTINNGTPITTANMGSYVPTNTNQLEGDFRTGANGAYVALANSSGNHFLATTEWVINYVNSKLG